MTALLAVDDLRVQFRTDHGAAHAVDGVSLHVNAGETLCVVGESGCGKSVTALAIMGLLPRPAAQVTGRIAFEGRDLLALDPAALADLRGNRLAMIFQEPMTSLNPAFTVGSQLGEVLVRHRGVRPSRRARARRSRCCATCASRRRRSASTSSRTGSRAACASG